MKKLLIAAAFAATFLPSQVFAQAKNFEGLSIAGNVTSAKSTTTAAAITPAGRTADDSGTSSGLDLQISYTLALDESFVLGIGVTLGMSVYKADMLGTTELKGKRVSLDFTPGIAISDTVLVFGKMSILTATAQAEDGSIGTQELLGVGYGAGIRANLNKNLFLQAIYDYNLYNKYNISGGATSIESKSNVLSLGVGYKF